MKYQRHGYCHGNAPGNINLSIIIAVMICSGASFRVGAQLTTALEFEGRGNWSIDGGTEGGSVNALVPPGSLVVQAFLYCATALGTPAPAGVVPAVVLEGVEYDSDTFSPLTFVQFPGFQTGMQAFRADATAQVADIVGPGSPTAFALSIDSVDVPLILGRLTGIVLAVIYQNESELYRRIVILDGGAETSGDSFSIQLEKSVDPEVQGFESLLSLAIGFSAGTISQRTTIDVQGRRLTSIAGGLDDSADGLTVGGLGDSPANPPDPFAILGADDELYDLSVGNAVDPSPFIVGGETEVNIETENIGEDDHLFFAALNIVVMPETPSVEIPTLGSAEKSAFIAVLVLAALVVLRRVSR